MIESDRHAEPMKWNLDVYMLQLDGSGTIERLLDWSDKYPGCHSDNPVVSPDGTKIAIQFGFRINQPGQGKGIVLFDLKKYRQFKK
jgi:Tol biopolymer transport system component